MDSGVPIWVQIKTQLEYLIATGGVPEGTQLPSVRQLSSRLGVAIDTVRQAYDELTRANLVATRRGRGFQVANVHFGGTLHQALVRTEFSTLPHRNDLARDALVDTVTKPGAARLI